MRNKYFYLVLLLLSVLVGCKTQKQHRNSEVTQETQEEIDQLVNHLKKLYA